MYGMETVAVTDRQVKKLEVAELKMVRWALGVTRKDKIRNEHIRGTAKTARQDEKLRGARLRCMVTSDGEMLDMWGGECWNWECLEGEGEGDRSGDGWM